ncbi:MAG: HAMP domain-containing histidine kinase [Lachnospiraceae bacterium]|nr:HAMP domain-containing histidine kinase [Lachnospiraceae bacterium]
MFRRSRIKIVALLMAILLLTLLGTIAVIYGVSYREMSQENRSMLELYAREYLENGGLPDTDVDGDDSGDRLPDEESANGEVPEDGRIASELSEEELPETIDATSGAGENEYRKIIKDDSFAASGSALGDLAGTDDTYGISRRRLELSTFYSVVFSADGSVLQVNNDDPSQMSDEVLTELAQSFLETGKSYGISRNMIYLVSGEDYTLVSMMDNTVVGESIITLLRYTVIFGAVAIVVVLVLAIFLSGWIIRPLEENYRRQNQFISDAGHELKTPVSTISTNAELLQREIGENRWLDNIRYENSRMTEIVRSLLDLLRAESLTSQAEQLERMDLGRAVTAGVLPFEARAFEEGFELSCEIADDIFIAGEASQIGKLISILVDNAFAHTNPSGRIVVSLEGGKGSAILTVANEGDPIPPESTDRIFDRFYRVDSSRTVSGQDGAAQAHYGLGLSIAKAIATAHRAKISVSCGDGMTKFMVVFPLKVK